MNISGSMLTPRLSFFTIPVILLRGYKKTENLRSKSAFIQNSRGFLNMQWSECNMLVAVNDRIAIAWFRYADLTDSVSPA